MKQNTIIVILICVIGVLSVLLYFSNSEKNELVEKLREAVATAQIDTAQLQSEIDRLKTDHKNEISKLKTETDSLIKRVRSDAVRVYVKQHQNVSADSCTGNGKDDTGLDSDFVAGLLDLARRGDTAIIQLNSCIDQYNAVREKLN